MRCFTSAAWLTSGRFKSFCAKTIWPTPTTARQRMNDLSVIVFIDLAITLPRFSTLRYQIIQGFSALPVKGCKANVFSATNEQGGFYEHKSSGFDRLVARYYPAVYSFAARLTDRRR